MLVLLKEESEPKMADGRIIEVHPSSNELVRTVTLPVENSTFKRSIQKTVFADFHHTKIYIDQENRRERKEKKNSL